MNLWLATLSVVLAVGCDRFAQHARQRVELLHRRYPAPRLRQAVLVEAQLIELMAVIFVAYAHGFALLLVFP